MLVNPDVVSVQEYLTADYEAPLDYIEGALEDRHTGEHAHSRIVAMLCVYFYALEKDLGVRVLPGVRFKVGENRYRVPDFVLVSSSNREKILTSPPLLCVEVVSSEDRMASVLTKVGDYHQAGVIDVWLISPDTRDCFVSRRNSGLRQATDGRLTALEGRVSVDIRHLID